MYRFLTMTAALAIALPGAGLAAMPAAPANLSGQDQTFLGTAFRTDDDEVTQGRIAAKQGGSSAIRSLGSTFQKAHAQDLVALAAVAKKIGFIPPANVGPGGKAADQSLHDVKGVTFNNLYLREELHAHQKAITAYKLEAAHGSNPAVVAYAKATLPVLEQHVTKIDTALKTVKH